MENYIEMSVEELKARIITRKTGIKNINEALRTLEIYGPAHNFAPFRPMEILELKRAELCGEIRALEKELARRAVAV